MLTRGARMLHLDLDVDHKLERLFGPNPREAAERISALIADDECHIMSQVVEPANTQACLYLIQYLECKASGKQEDCRHLLPLGVKVNAVVEVSFRSLGECGVL